MLLRFFFQMSLNVGQHSYTPPPFPKKKNCLSTQVSHLKDPAGFDEGTNARKRERRIALKEKN